MANRSWRNRVKSRDNGFCVICGDLGTDAHHIRCEGYFPELKNDIDNGVTLCKACHVLAHRGRFGSANKGKYSANDSIERLQKRAISPNIFPLIAILVHADVESEKYALSQRNTKNSLQS